MTKFQSKLTTLRTVYPPMSNADAFRLMRDADVEKMLRTSDFYMIVARAQARFLNPKVDQDAEEITFDFVVGNGPANSVRFILRELPGVEALGGANLFIEIDNAGTGFKIWDGPANEAGADVVEWFTTEKLLWDRARERPGIVGLDNVRDLATYDLLYVGIAKKGDSFDRLLARGHKTRQDILSAEPQRFPGARVSDEIFLVLFKVDPILIQTFDPNHEFSDDDLNPSIAAKRIVADAEKAFVHLLSPEYNGEKFKNYPRGTDGLYRSGYGRYGYVIGEEMAFNTARGSFRGSLGRGGMIDNDADAIFVTGDEVTLFRAGVDFPDESGSLASPSATSV